ncbi:MAG: type III-A CRISPR-associated RAMP protein Csm4 [Candidatus Binatia bacterium]
MTTFSTYHLTFRSPLHIGERGVGLEVTRPYIPADTLFSAICSAWRELYGVDSLRQDVLDWFTDDESGSEPFFLSSAFPSTSSVRFFPKLLTPSSNVHVEDTDLKAFKRVRFVSAPVFAGMVNKENLTFRKEDCVNGEVMWVTAEEKKQFQDWTDDASGEIVLWKTAVVPRVTLDRITSASEIWHFGEVRFAEGVGLWFAVDFNRDHGDELRRKFEAVLHVLGDTGLGGERGAGRGLFSMEGPIEEPLPGINDSTRFVTLSPVCPQGVRQVDELTSDGAAYELMPRRGWVTSPEASNLRRKMVWMFTEGSVLVGKFKPRAGRLVNVKPDACPHDVWRYGFAFPVGVKT